jgi:hypothetical protein
MEQRNEQFGGLRGNQSLVEVVEAYYPSAPVSTVFEVLWEKLRALPMYRTSLEVNEAELWAIFLQTGMSAEAFIEALLADSKEVYLADPDSFESEEEYYCLNNESMLWENFRGLGFFIKDRARLKEFLQEKIGRKFAIYPHDMQVYDDLVFDFREKKLFRGDEELLTLGAKTLPITKLLLENRGRKFTYEELAEELGEISVFNHWQTAPNYKVKIDKIFARLNRACGSRIFQFWDKVVYLEP